MAVIARLIDHEGRVWTEMAIPSRLSYIEVAASPKLTGRMVGADEGPMTLAFQTVVFRLERQAGDGVLIYRRESPLW